MDYDAIIQYGSRILVFLTAIPLHETAHAWVSEKLGDPTARNLGRITLNPLKHLDMVGFLMMLFVGIGWAKPVPVDPRYYKDRKKGMALSAAAGPVSNLLMAFVLMLVFKVYRMVVLGGDVAMWQFVVYYILYYMVTINVMLAIFNLLPIPPFDGSRIFLVFLPDALYFKAMKYERVFGAIVLAVVFFGFLNQPLGWLNTTVMHGLDTATAFLGRLY